MIRDHWLTSARRVMSPNFGQRPPGIAIDALIIHNISLPPGEFGGPWVDQLFCNTLNPDQHPYFREIAHLQVSAHLLINREGLITQYVGFDKKAWHAGASSLQGRAGCNDFSIGIELEGCDDQPFSDAQYRALVEVTQLLLQTYPAIQQSRIVGHSDIAPGRKTDPGPFFDWERYRKALS